MASHELGAEYHVHFDTKSLKGALKTVKVTLENDVISGNQEARVDLADHPLYPYLEQYVLDNPSNRR